MTGEQLAKLIMASNDLKKCRSLLADIIKEGGDSVNRVSLVLDKLTECDDELCKIQNSQ